jgi:hypothetical protein
MKSFKNKIDCEINMVSSTIHKIKMIDIFKAARPILLSHHPNCRKFENHIADFNGKKVCLGCIIIYPTLIISLLTLILLGILWIEIIGWYLLPLGLVLFSIKFFNVQNKPLKVIVNILVGISGAMFILGTFSLPIFFILQILVFILFTLGVSFLAFLKLKRKLRVCSENCEYKGQWHLCPGLNVVYHNIRYINSNQKSESRYFPYTRIPNP